MSDPNRANPETAEEISTLKTRIQELEQIEAEHRQTEEKLRLSLQQLRLLIDTGPDFFFLKDLNLRYQLVNSESAKFIGRFENDILGRTDMDLMPEEAATICQENERQVVREKKIVVTVEPVGDRFYETYRFPVTASDEVVGVGGVVRDVTSGIRAERDLRESEMLYRSLVNTTNTGYVVLDQEGKVLDANQEYVRLSGHNDLKEIRGRSVIEWTVDGEKEKNAKAVAQCVRDGYIRNFQIVYVDGQGKVTPIEINATVVERGGAAQILTLCRNVAERKRMEDALIESEQKYRSIYEYAVEGIFQTTHEGRLVSVNPALAKMFGFSSPEEMTRIVSNVEDQLYVDLNDRERFKGLLQERGAVSNFEVRLYNRNRQVRWFSIRARAVHDLEGKLVFIEGFAEDINARKEAEEALRREKETFFAILENDPTGVALIGTDGTYIYVNPSFSRITGYSLGDVPSGRDWFRKAFPDPAYRKLAVDSWKTDRLVGVMGKASDREFVVTRSDGKSVILEIRTTFMEDFSVAVFVDVTERKRAEEAMRRSENRLSSIIEFLPDATFVIDNEGKVVAWNKAIEEMTGVRKENIIGKGDYEYAIPFYGERRPIVIDLVFERDEEKDGKYDHIEEQGHIFLAEAYVPLAYQGKGAHLSARASPLFDPEGNVMGAIESIRDITEQKRIAKELRESEERYRTAIENSSDGVTMVKDGHHFYVNRKFLEIFGFDGIDQVVGQAVGFMVHPDDRERVKDIQRRRARGEEAPQNYEFKAIKTNGNVIFIEASVASTTYKGERISLAYVRDVTSRKNLEARLRQSQNLESIGTLAGGIAHDFNNLLMALTGNISLAKMYLPPENYASQFLEEAERISLGGADLTNRLITFSKGGIPMRKVVSINKLIKDIFGVSLADSKIGSEHILSDELWPVKADETQLKQAIRNIVLNAKEAMPHGGIIKAISANVVLSLNETVPLQPGDYVKVTIEDQGVGIGEEDLPKIFDPYFTTKGMGSDRGMGLGLAVVYSIIKRHNGYVAVESTKGKGTAAHIYLPAHKTEHGIVKKGNESAGSSRGKLLFMDDEVMIRDVNEKIPS